LCLDKEGDYVEK